MPGKTVPFPASGGFRGVERRAAVRYPCELDASYRVPSEDEDLQWPAQVQDVSTLGVGVLVNRPLERGTSLVLEMRTKDHSLSYTLPARVAYVIPLTGEMWWLGCAFARPLGEQELQTLL
jgi:hypothetical protein